MPSRPIVTLAAAGLLVVSLAACSGTADATAEPTSTSPQGATVDTIWGPVDVPANPQRIVALGFPEATALADLGVTPVGRPSWLPELPAYDALFRDIPVVDAQDGTPNLEKIASLHPDLILWDEFPDEKKKDVYDQLSQIAPTVDLEWKQAGGNWQAEAEGTAQAVGKTQELEALKAEYAAHAEKIKTQYADVLAANTIDLISGDDQNYYLYSANSSHGRVLADAGVRFGAAADQSDGYVEYSNEHYDLLADTDYVLIFGSTPEELDPVTKNAIFQSSKAARAGHATGSAHFFASSYDVAGALLDDLEAALQKLQG